MRTGTAIRDGFIYRTKLNTGGNPLKLADLRGKYVLLDFWFAGCLPCRQDFPSVKLLHELYKGKVWS